MHDFVRRWALSSVRCLTVAALLCIASAALSQAPIHSVFRGRMLDSTGRGVPGVRVTLSEAPRAAVSDSTGLFLFENVPSGELTLAISHPKFVPLTISIPGALRDSSTVPVLLFAKDSALADERADRVAFGRITDINGAPIRDVELTFLATGFATRSDALGWFSANLVSPDTQSVRLRKIGYAPQVFLLHPANEGALRVDVTLGQVTVQLAQTVVREFRSVPRLRRFFSNMERFTDGQFLTRPQIDPAQYLRLTHLLARMRGVHIGYNVGARPVPQTGRNCTMRVLLNGNEVDLESVDLDGVAQVRDLVGIEVYNASTRIPLEFRLGFVGSSSSADCGAVGLWTR